MRVSREGLTLLVCKFLKVLFELNIYVYEKLEQVQVLTKIFQGRSIYSDEEMYVNSDDPEYEASGRVVRELVKEIFEKDI